MPRLPGPHHLEGLARAEKDALDVRLEGARLDLDPADLPRKWGSIGKAIPNVDLFVADEQGIFFPGQDRWLFVPWPNISNIRVVEIMDGESSTGIAFNLRLSPQEKTEFFRQPLRPADHLHAGSAQLAVGYASYPPSPKALATILLGLKHKPRQ